MPLVNIYFYFPSLIILVLNDANQVPNKTKYLFTSVIKASKMGWYFIFAKINKLRGYKDGLFIL